MANTTTKKTTATTNTVTTANTKKPTAKKAPAKKAPAKKAPAKKPETKGASMSKLEEAVAEFGKAMEDFARNKEEVPDIPAVTAPAAPEENPAPKKKGRPPKIDYPEEKSKAVTEQKLHTLNEKRYALYSLVNESLKYMIEAKYLCADMAKDKHKIISNKYAELYRRIDKLVDTIHDDVLQKVI